MPLPNTSHETKQIQIKKILKFLSPLFLLSFFPLLLWGINGPAILTQGDEYMHIATIRQSLSASSWLLPQLEGFPNYYKPPLLFWLGMLSESLFGNALLALRLPAALAGMGCIFLVYLLLKKLKTPALLPSIAYALSLGTLKFSKLMMMEQFMALFFLLTVWAFVSYLQSKKNLYILLAGSFSAIAYFFKGPLFQVYTAFLFLAWGLPVLLHFDLKGRYKGKNHLPEVLKVALLLHLPLILPLLWNAWLFWGAKSIEGRALLQFFFVNENINKFSSINQPIWRIFEGWVLYSIPWSVLLLGGMALALFQKVATLRYHIAKLLLLTALSISLLHMLPNRKDPYYIIPALPLVFVALPTLLSGRPKLQAILQKLIRGNLYFSGFIALLSFAAALLLQASRWDLLLLSIPVVWHFVAWYGNWSRHSHPSLEEQRKTMLLAGALAIIGFQFVLLPQLSLPLLPKQFSPLVKKDLCLISQEPWDAFALQISLPDTKIHHAMPGQEAKCIQNAKGVIDLSGRIEKNDSYKTLLHPMAHWPRWKEEISAPDVLKNIFHIQRLQYKAGYWEKRT